MACKLVAIYQKHFEDGEISELSTDSINAKITTPLKYYAKFDFTKMESQKQVEEEQKIDQYDAQESWNP